MLLAMPVEYANAQTLWSYGIKGGISLSRVDWSAVPDYDQYSTRFVGGGFVTAQVYENFGVQVEGLYSQKGGQFSQAADSLTIDSWLKIDYVEIPVLAFGMLPAGDRTRLRFFGGPALAFLLQSKGIIQSNALTPNNVEEDLKRETRFFDLGLMLGIGCDIKINEKASVDFSASYNLGLTNFDDSQSNDDIKHRAFGFMVGLRYPYGITEE
jgi:hypothetical protein